MWRAGERVRARAQERVGKKKSELKNSRCIIPNKPDFGYKLWLYIAFENKREIFVNNGGKNIPKRQRL